MDGCADIYQPIRMGLIWPLLVGGVMTHTVLFLAQIINGSVNRWQAAMAGIAGIMAAVVTVTIANRWDGHEAYWLAFTLGLAFIALLLIVTGAIHILEAGRDA